ncbi:MAG: flagellar hook-associated protein FlgK, partial [Defluviitaleaceae bacterium]|nr:flagellar hook-associated protein FlgK [Defluviitaleaceae bacterium]
MRSAFFGLHVTTSGMNAARANLNTIAHNIANTETPGFSRQVANQQATMPLRGSPGRGMVGTGSQITSIHRVRNQFLDTKFWAQNSVLGQFNTKHDVMSLVRGILMEGEAAGITRDINNVFSRQSDLHTNAHDLTYRRNFLSSLDTFAVSLNSQYQQLRQQQVDLNQEIAIVIGQVNSKGQQINALNRSIFIMELDGSNANDLRDQRDLLIDQLSRLVNVEVRETETNADFAAGRVTDPRESRLHLSILIDGVVFINHFDINPIEVRQRVLSDGTSIARNPEEMGVKYDIFWSSGMRFNMYSPTLSGELAGLIQLRDGNGGNFARFQTTGGLPATHSVGTLAFPLPIGTTAITGISTDPIVIYGARNALEIVEMINAAAGVTVTASLGGGGIRLTANTSGAVTITTAPPLINHITGHAGVDAADMPQVVPGGTAMVPPMVPPFANPEDYAVRLVFGTDSRVDMSTTGVLQVRIGNTIRNIPYTDFRLEFDHNGNPVSGVFNVRAEDMNSPGTPIDIPALFDGATEITSGRTVNYMGV